MHEPRKVEYTVEYLSQAYDLTLYLLEIYERDQIRWPSSEDMAYWERNRPSLMKMDPDNITYDGALKYLQVLMLLLRVNHSVDVQHALLDLVEVIRAVRTVTWTTSGRHDKAKRLVEFLNQTQT